MPRHVPTDRDAYRRLRWQARWLTTAAAIPFVLMLVNLVGFARMSGDAHKVAAWWFFQLGLYTIVATMVVWWAWRRSWNARPVVLKHDAGPGTTIGVPELDAPPRDHLSIRGDQPPPRRW